jgi:hypothetical protein
MKRGGGGRTEEKGGGGRRREEGEEEGVSIVSFEWVSKTVIEIRHTHM